MIKLKIDPLLFFKNRKDPFSLYAGKKWPGNESAHIDAEINSYSKQVTAGQLENGSWENSPYKTLKNMFFLHLTKREKGNYSDSAMFYLFSVLEGRSSGIKPLETDTWFYDMPFLPAKPESFLPCAVLFTASVFGYSKKSAYADLFRDTEKYYLQKKKEISQSEKYNFLRASLVNPDTGSEKTALDYVRYFKEIFDSRNMWGSLHDSCQIFNILSHSRDKDAVGAVEKALPYILEMQNSSGSWGRGESEAVTTFLVVHSLGNIRLIK